ncbi:DUF4870 domain-containing protein [Salisediminibacterium beveridgei]|uniref:Chloroplast import component protein (Tic20) n=1 Tax=Salisediminibacterium beveridgei TaxID=632773 RepID=A0A1D7QRV1_9BACI|nr:hypothetical protein [Salisediminibacterium beveridgei]AOM81719.1 hypothetical protein BBEV_0325 [Salisediminibacterium beveridgei]
MSDDMGSTVKSGSSDAEDNKVMAVLAYLGILVLVPLLAAKESRFAQYHANQGLVLFIAGIGGFIVLSIFSTITSMILGNIPVLGALVGLFLGGLLYFIAWIAVMILVIMGILNAVKGEEKPLPVIGKYNLLKLDQGGQSA